MMITLIATTVVMFECQTEWMKEKERQRERALNEKRGSITMEQEREREISE